MIEQTDFSPDWASPPGDTIMDVLRERQLSVSEFAEQIGQPVAVLNDLLQGRVKVSLELARQLAGVCGGTIEFWMNRDFQYQLDRERKEARNDSWLRELPLHDMVEFGWAANRTQRDERLEECLQFFAVPDLSAWEKRYRSMRAAVAFRTSPAFESKPGIVAAWLRKGEIEAEAIACEQWDGRTLRLLIEQFRELAVEHDLRVFVPKLTQLCATAGVALVIVRAPRGCPASGATRFITARKAIIQLSFRYLTDDQFWFTFFHEVGHLLLHSANEFFLEGEERTETTQEREANEFAGSVLIPPEFLGRLLEISPTTLNIARLARQAGVSPGIVVGQLQHHKKIRPNHFNRLKARYQWEQ